MVATHVGYARVSTTGQRLDVQIDQLTRVGCEKIFAEHYSGGSDARPQLRACLEYLRQGDTLIITRLDRLARSLAHLIEIATRLERKQVQLRGLDQNLDTSDATGRLLFNMLGAIAPFERELGKERQCEGILKAQRRGVHCGRTKRLSPSQVVALRQKRASGVLVRALMAEYGLTKMSISRYLGRTADAHPSTEAAAAD